MSLWLGGSARARTFIPTSVFSLSRFPDYHSWKRSHSLTLKTSHGFPSSLSCNAGVKTDKVLSPFQFPAVESIEAVLFDVDGTLCDSDPLHYFVFREMLQEVGFQGGVPISEEFFSKNLSGMHNDETEHFLFPDWDDDRCKKFMDNKEAFFRKMAINKLKPVKGLSKLRKWIESHGIRRAAVTNACRENAELMISIVGLTDFFEEIIIGSECERAKPFPDPYLKALKTFNIPSSKAFALEDSPSGLTAAAGAGLAALGLKTRNPEQSLLDAGATFLIKDFEDPKLWEALSS